MRMICNSSYRAMSSFCPPFFFFFFFFVSSTYRRTNLTILLSDKILHHLSSEKRHPWKVPVRDLTPSTATLLTIADC
jgi:hypothetical protein